MIIVISRFSGASDHDVQWTGALSWRRYVCHLNTSPATATPTCARKKAVPRGFSQTNEKPFGHRSTVKINVVHVHTIHGCGRISGAHILHEPRGPNIGGGSSLLGPIHSALMGVGAEIPQWGPEGEAPV